MAFDVRDVFLEASAELTEVVREVMQELALPQMKSMVRQSWMQAPEELRERFADENPELYRKLMAQIRPE